MLKIQNLTKIFDKNGVNEKIALKDFNLNLQNGDFLTVIGDNGAGKSTLMNCIAGVYKTDGGAIFLDDNDISGLPEHKRAKFIGRVFQDPMKGTAFDMTIEENLAIAENKKNFCGLQWGITAKKRVEYASKLEVLAMGLENMMTKKVRLLSGGQRQAVSLLMASLQPSSILLLDEHTAALDPKTTDFVMQLTDKIVREQKLTTLMVTHSMKQALEYGDRTVMLHQGQVAFDVSGEKRKQMDVPDLLQLFQQNRHEQLADDGLLLGV